MLFERGMRESLRLAVERKRDEPGVIACLRFQKEFPDHGSRRRVTEVHETNSSFARNIQGQKVGGGVAPRKLAAVLP